MNRCINLSGLERYELRILERATHHNGDLEMEFVEKHSPKMRWKYCTFKCPVRQTCKFRGRYNEQRN
jgi:hypothetical protein